MSWWYHIWEDFWSSWKNTGHITKHQHSRAEIELYQKSFEIVFSSVFNFSNRRMLHLKHYVLLQLQKKDVFSYPVTQYVIKIYSVPQCNCIENCTSNSLNFALESCCSVTKYIHNWMYMKFSYCMVLILCFSAVKKKKLLLHILYL